MHSHEWGARETTGSYATLQANAIKGLQAMRDVMATYAATKGLLACGTITDSDLVAFASATSSTRRVSAAQALYTACDTALVCAADSGGQGSGDAGVAPADPPPWMRVRERDADRPCERVARRRIPAAATS